MTKIAMDPSSNAVSADGEQGRRTLGLCIIGHPVEDLWTERSDQRLRRQFARHGVTKVLDRDSLPTMEGPVICLRADAVLDGPVVAALCERSSCALIAENCQQGLVLAVHAPVGRAGAGAELLDSGQTENAGPFETMSSAELCSTYWSALRKRETPYALQVTEPTRSRVEWRMFMGTYKGATDFVTKWLWPWPAFHVTKLCARLGLTPNMVTYASLVLVFAALYWFWTAEWALGLIAAWIMTFLDTVDGKLARITLSSSKFGNALDHGIDLVHPPFWYLAWGLGLQHGPFALTGEQLTYAMVIIFAGYILQRLLEGLSMLLFKIEIHIWRPIDSIFRQVTARRNPNLVLLTLSAIAGRPDMGLWAVVIWTAACLLIHVLQLIQAWLVWRRQGALESWMAKGATPL